MFPVMILLMTKIHPIGVAVGLLLEER